MRERAFVQFTVSDRGYGFIQRPGCPNLFFHATAVRDAKFDDIRTGDLVEFEVIQTSRGLAAVNVTLVR
jgi:CspA family cold shock protein